MKSTKYDRIYEMYLSSIRIQSDNLEFNETGKIPKGMKIDYIDVRWNEIWRSDTDEVEPYFVMGCNTLRAAYTLAFKLAAGYTNHTEQFTRKELDGDHLKDWIDMDNKNHVNRRVSSINTVTIEVYLSRLPMTIKQLHNNNLLA